MILEKTISTLKACSNKNNQLKKKEQYKEIEQKNRIENRKIKNGLFYEIRIQNPKKNKTRTNF